MKKSIFTILVMFMPMLVSADPVEIDGILYNLVNKAKIAEVTHPIDHGYELTGELYIPSTVTYNGEEYNVTIIGNGAFWGTEITSVIIPEGVTKIDNDAFMECRELKSITIPKSLAYVGKDAFGNDFSISSIYISSLEDWFNVEFVSSIVQSSLEETHFYLNGNLIQEIVIPEDMTSIPNYFLSGFSDVRSIILHDNVTTIGDGAFSGCSNLTSITIPDNITSIGNGAFSGCSNLTSITIPDNITAISSALFWGCSKLSSISFSDEITSIERWAFNGCSSLSSFVIPESVKSVDTGAFAACTGLTSITIPKQIKDIKEYTYSGCTSLTSVTAECAYLRSISECAFADCTDLTDVYLYSEYVPVASQDAFKGSYAEYVTLHVPETLVEAYKTQEPWNLFMEIVPITDTAIRNAKTAQSAKAFYTLDGVQSDKPQKGINIIRTNEGKAKKVLVK